MLQDSKNIKNDAYINTTREISSSLRTDIRMLKGAAKVFDKLGPADTLIDLGIRASKGDFSGMSAGALGSAAGLLTIALLGASTWPAAGIILAGAIIGFGTDKAFKKFFSYIGLRKVDDQVNDNFNNAYGFTPRVAPPRH